MSKKVLPDGLVKVHVQKKKNDFVVTSFWATKGAVKTSVEKLEIIDGKPQPPVLDDAWVPPF
jgi:hypothetical protein